MPSAPPPRSSRCVSVPSRSSVRSPPGSWFLVGVLIFLRWLLQVDSARKRGVLLEAVQVLADLDLSINKAYISSDGRWFMDVFHVTDRLGRKLTDDSVITYIQQSIGTWNGPSKPAALEGLTVLELTGADRTGLISEVFAVLADMSCSVVDARAWSHRGRLACLVYLRDEDVVAASVERIEARLAPLLRGDSEASGGAVAAVPAGSIAHADRRLHQLMYASRDKERAFPTPWVSVESWAERGYSVVTVQCPRTAQSCCTTWCARSPTWTTSSSTAPSTPTPAKRGRSSTSVTPTGAPSAPRPRCSE
uniref:ACT domain-containing protein ACR n=1 Tax=Aegilops tauschii subsp. strangulata TaxID=200361 RepID=A0A453S1E2_AEGTS